MVHPLSAFQGDAYQDLPFLAEVRTITHVDKHMKDKSNSHSWQEKLKILVLFGRSFPFSFSSFLPYNSSPEGSVHFKGKPTPSIFLGERGDSLVSIILQDQKGTWVTTACIYQAAPAGEVGDRLI